MKLNMRFLGIAGIVLGALVYIARETLATMLPLNNEMFLIISMVLGASGAVTIYLGMGKQKTMQEPQRDRAVNGRKLRGIEEFHPELAPEKTKPLEEPPTTLSGLETWIINEIKERGKLTTSKGIPITVPLRLFGKEVEVKCNIEFEKTKEEKP